MRSYHQTKIHKIKNFPMCTVEKFKFLGFLLDDKNATYFSSTLFMAVLAEEDFACWSQQQN